MAEGSAICDYEREVLSRIAFGTGPAVPGAAWNAAFESLAERGLISAGKLTREGRAALDCATPEAPDPSF